VRLKIKLRRTIVLTEIPAVTFAVAIVTVMRFPVRAVFVFLACVVVCIRGLWSGAAAAAEINASPVPGKPDSAIIEIKGEFELSDVETFRAVSAPYPKAIVIFHSNGGKSMAGIEIGTRIRMRGYTTVVLDGATCASACATAWIGGAPRMMGPGARIGFHAASIEQGGQLKESGLAGAILGAYLERLGLPVRAIAFINQAHPEEMSWLTMADARREGIDVSLLTLPDRSSNDTAAKPENSSP